jgi:formate hydrogenlyase subunit 3/multisubunit Na+/H+ antiporter MnhD subunit
VALGVLVGVTQRDPHALLGYSSIAKMGLITALFGIALARPEAAPLIIAALVPFAMHHLLVKGALFLGLGEWRHAGNRSWVVAGLGLLALAMAGAPLTAGALAKTTLGEALAIAGADLGPLLLLSATGTALLMLRLMWLVTRARPRRAAHGRGASLAWLALALMALSLPFHPADLTASGDGLVPLGLGLTLAVLAWVLTWALARKRARPWRGIPPGDVLHLLPRRSLRRLLRMGRGRLPARMLTVEWRYTSVRERTQSLAVAGLFWLTLFVSLLSAVLLPG